MGLFDKLRQGLQKSKEAVLNQIDNVFKAFVKIDEDLLEELEEILIAADIGVNTSGEIIERLRHEIKERRLTDADGNEVKELLREIIVEIIGENTGINLETKPSVEIGRASCRERV